MKPAPALVAVMVLCCLGISARGGQQTVVEGREEVLCLDGLGDPARWGPAECTVEESKELKAQGRPTLHLHIPVDHLAGEKEYPIGWPRMYADLKEEEKGWTDFERFEFLAYATMSRKRAPRQALSFQVLCPDRRNAFHRNLSEIQLGQWVRLSIPIRSIKSAKDAARLGFNISESDYKHGDKLDFYLGAFRLVRAAEFGLTSLKVLNPVLYQDRPTLKVELDVAGPPQKVAQGLPLALRTGERTIRLNALAVQRGLQSVEVDLREQKLEPGAYTLIAFDDDPARGKVAPFRLVESPWQEK
ncbi:MAG TPA: hypothetical protein VNE39_14380 [Planctomycetota bacterium]|nr:hypothetical protein [Planctomycetota bacterium]